MKINMTELNKSLIDAISNRKIFIFDLDGTLTESKANLDEEMASLLCGLLEKKIVAIMGGGDSLQFQNQLLDHLHCPGIRLKDLFILPTSGGRMYKYDGKKWQPLYENILTSLEKEQILDAFEKAFLDINYAVPPKACGKVIEDRESQITFSALGQKASLIEKEKWNEKQDIRSQLKVALEKHLPTFEVRLGGLTSVDVTKKGIDKAYGIKQIKKQLSIPIKEMVFIGDALYEGGNDCAVIQTGVYTIQISGPTEVKHLIQGLLQKFSKNNTV